jgi:integrase
LLISLSTNKGNGRPLQQADQVTKRIGFHSFRHGLATMLRQRNVDIKTAQELMRHANSRITLEIYQQSVGEEKREAQDRVTGMLLAPNRKGAEGSNPSAPLKETI